MVLSSPQVLSLNLRRRQIRISACTSRSRIFNNPSFGLIPLFSRGRSPRLVHEYVHSQRTFNRAIFTATISSQETRKIYK